MDAASEPIGYMVVSDGGDRIHFLDWGGVRGPGMVLVHGLGASAWAWTAVARRLAAGDALRRTIAMDGRVVWRGRRAVPGVHAHRRHGYVRIATAGGPHTYAWTG